jgi:hypothetical protein
LAVVGDVRVGWTCVALDTCNIELILVLAKSTHSASREIVVFVTFWARQTRMN